MLARTFLCIGLGLAATTAIAGKPALTRDELFRDLPSRANDLDRYDYLQRAMARLAPDDHPIAMQLLASAEDELGLYDKALRDFPLKPRIPADLSLPRPEAWHTADAVAVIARLAADRRLVMVNEAHHDAHTRELTLALLPRLRTLGFTHFAAEALGDRDPGLARRGYPTSRSGSEYLHEPLYGEIVRTAIRLGFVVVPYDGLSTSLPDREREQASNLYRRVFATDPHARLFVHAGYAHIDKAKGRLGHVRPMAMQLAQMAGVEPLSVDQTSFRDVQSGDDLDPYHRLVQAFRPRRPVVLAARSDGKVWSAEPAQYDVSVILPPGGDATEHTSWVSLGPSSVPMKITETTLGRPDWLGLDDRRRAYPVSGSLCEHRFPCVVEAHYAGEPDAAIAADRYLFDKAAGHVSLYLFPGRYRLRSFGIDGRTVHEQVIVVADPARAGPVNP